MIDVIAPRRARPKPLDAKPNGRVRKHYDAGGFRGACGHREPDGVFEWLTFDLSKVECDNCLRVAPRYVNHPY